MEISFDPEKRQKTLKERGLDFQDAIAIFHGLTFTREDVRVTYPERRFITSGELNGRAVILVWTPTPRGRGIISMRYSHAKEVRSWHERVE